MGCTVREAQGRCSAYEFIEWVAYDQVNPWGPERGDLQAAIMPYTFANAFAGKGQKPKFKDYVLHFGEKVKQVGSRIWAAMEGARMYQNSIHGKDKNAKNG